MGREALEAAQARPLTKSLMTFAVDAPETVMAGRETILRNGVAVGYLTSGGYGFSIGKSIGLGYVRHDAGVAAGSYALVVAGDVLPANLATKPRFDPEAARIKG